MRFQQIAVLSLALAFAPGAGAWAQSSSLKDQIVGAWEVVSYENTRPDGTKTRPYGERPHGLAIYDRTGRYVTMLTKPDRPKWKSRNRNEATVEEIKSAAMGTVAQFGSWSIDADGKTLVRDVRSALVPNNEGTQAKLTVTISSDEMRIVDPNAATGGKTETVLRRVK